MREDNGRCVSLWSCPSAKTKISAPLRSPQTAYTSATATEILHPVRNLIACCVTGSRIANVVVQRATGGKLMQGRPPSKHDPPERFYLLLQPHLIKQVEGAGRNDRSDRGVANAAGRLSQDITINVVLLVTIAFFNLTWPVPSLSFSVVFWSALVQKSSSLFYTPWSTTRTVSCDQSILFHTRRRSQGRGRALSLPRFYLFDSI